MSKRIAIDSDMSTERFVELLDLYAALNYKCGTWHYDPDEDIDEAYLRSVEIDELKGKIIDLYKNPINTREGEE